jgi:hypothetical protein
VPSIPIPPARGAAAVVALLALAACGCGDPPPPQRGRERPAQAARPPLPAPPAVEAPGAEPPEGSPCSAEEVAHVGARVTALLETGDGEVWIGTLGGGLHRARQAGPGGERGGGADAEPPPAGGAAQGPVPGLSGGQLLVNALAEHDGLVWAATRGGLLAFDGPRRALALLDGEEVTALAGARGALYAGTAGGLRRISADRGAEPVDATGPDGEPLRVTALAAGRGQLLVGTASGAYALPLATLEAPLLQRTARRLPPASGAPPAGTGAATARPPGLAFGALSAVAASGAGVLVGSADGAVHRLACTPAP